MEVRKIINILLPLLCSLSITVLVKKYSSNADKKSKSGISSKLHEKRMNLYLKKNYKRKKQENRRKLASEFTFYVMGDMPYSKREEDTLKSQLEELPSDGRFLIHVGDMQKPDRTDCEFNAYQDVRNLFYNYSGIPVFIVPGDNDYIDCERPRHARAVWLKHFSRFEDYWSPLPFGVDRKSSVIYDYWDDDDGDDDVAVSEDYFDDKDFTDDDYGVQFWDNARNGRVDFDSEYCAFLYNNVIFIGVNIQVGRHQSEEFSKMIEWTEKSLLKYEDDYQAIVIFGHAGVDHVKIGYFDKLKRIHDDSWLRDIPLLYIHGNRHEYDFYKPFGRDNMAALQVDRGKIAPPLKITIDFNRDFPFKFDRRK